MSRVAKDGIIVESQEYGAKHWLRPGSIGRGVSELLFKDYQGVMDRLRLVDEQIRAIALGRGGDGQPDISVVYAIKQAKAALRDNRLIDALYYASLVDIIARNVIGRASPLVDEIKKEVYKQYARYKDPKAIQYLRNLEQAGEQKKAQQITNEIIVNADVLQGIYRTIMRGDPLSRSWKAEVEKFKVPVQNVIAAAEQFATLLLASFDRMGIARASGRISDWTSEIVNLSKLQPKFNEEVKKAFESIKPLMEHAKEEGINEQEGQEQGQQEQVGENYIYDAMMNVYKNEIPVVVEEEGEEIPIEVEEPQEPALEAQPTETVPEATAPEATTPVAEPSVPVEQVVKPTEPEPVKATEPESKPVRRGPGRPTRRESTKDKELEQLEALRAKLLENQPGESPVASPTPEATPEPVPEPVQPEAPKTLDFQAGMDYLDTLTPEQKESSAKVLLAASQNAEDKDLFDDDGVLIGSVKGGIVTVDGTDLVVDVATAEKLLAYIEKANLVEPDITPAITEEEVVEPVAAEPEPVVAPAEPEPVVAPEKQSEPVKLEEVDSDGEPDRAIVFTNASPTDQRILKSLSKVLGKDVNVVSPKDRDTVKSNYPKAQFFTYGDEPQGGETQISSEILGLLSGRGRMGTDKKNKILELLGMPVKPVAPKPVAKPVAPKPEAKPETTVGDEDKPVVLTPGTAKVSNVTASVNENTANFLQRSASVPFKDADIAVILLQLSKEFVVTGVELEAAQAALKSYFNKDFVLLADRQLAISRIEGLEKSGKSVAVFMWQRSDFRSAINITKTKAPAAEAEVTASVDNAVIKLANERFFNQLKKAAELNDPYLLARMMLQYSEVMEEKDPQLSMELLAKAQEILNV